MERASKFGEYWGFPSAVQKIFAASEHALVKTGTKYRSGRDRWEARFYDAEGELKAVCDAMQLVSKKTGQPYFMCRKEPQAESDAFETLYGERE